MQTITLFEHQSKTFQELEMRSDAPVLTQLERLNWEQQAEIIAVGRHGVTARQYVGVLRVGAWTFQILPKIDYDGDADSQGGTPSQRAAIGSATRNLLHLLAYTHDLTLYQKHSALLHTQVSDWFELLTRLLAEELHRRIKYGVDRAYVSIEERLPTIRGAWKIQQQITRLPHELHLFDVSYDEFLSDTRLNRVFRFVVERLLHFTRDHNNRRLLRDIADWMAEVPLMPHIGPAFVEAVRFTRLNDRFRPAFNLARLFLESLAPLLVLENRQSFAFLFDMNSLFEQFVAGFLKRHRVRIFDPPFANLRVIAQASSNPFYLAERIPGNQQVFRLRPDILLMTPDGGVAAILDTKYKQLDLHQTHLGVSEVDFYQMLAYAIRLNCPNAILLYPAPKRSSVAEADYRVQGHEATVRAATIDLHQPLDQPGNLIEHLRHSLKSLLGGRT